MFGCEEIAGRDDLAQREGAEPVLNEAMKPAQVQEQLGGRVRDQLVGAVRHISTAKVLPQAASGMILQNHRRLPVSIFRVKIAALGCLQHVTGRIFKISIISKKQAKTLSLIFSSTKKQQIVKTISACTESNYFIL